MADKKIQWHQAFVAAIYLEFKENSDDLVYEKEYNLNTKPLEIDLLVIKKNKDLQISNEIGKLFRGYNIIEYKSPEDHLNIDSFYKTSAYASLYKAYGETVDSRPAEDITVSMIRDTKPVKLFQYFKEHHIKVTNPYQGIYYIWGSVLFPTQIIVGNELRKEEHKWLKLLAPGLQKEDIREFVGNISQLTKKYEKELADSILEVVTKVNRQVIEELKGDENVCQALLEIMEPEINEIVHSAVKSTRDSMTLEMEEAVKLTRDSMMLEMEEKNRKTIFRAIESSLDLNFSNTQIKQLQIGRAHV